MGRYSKDELAKKDLLDLVRTDVRLKYRQLQRHELNDVENDALEEQEARRQAGLPIGIDMSKRSWTRLEEGDNEQRALGE